MGVHDTSPAEERAPADDLLPARKGLEAALALIGPLGPRQVLALQRAIGNAATQRVLARRPTTTDSATDSTGGVPAVTAGAPTKPDRGWHLDEAWFRGSASPPAAAAILGQPGLALDLVRNQHEYAADLADRLTEARADGDEDRQRTLQAMQRWLGELVDAAYEALTVNERTEITWLFSHRPFGPTAEQQETVARVFETAPATQAAELSDYLLGDGRAQLQRLERVLGGDHLDRWRRAITPLFLAAQYAAGTAPEADEMQVLLWSGRPGLLPGGYSYDDVSWNGNRTKLIIKYHQEGGPLGWRVEAAPEEIIAVKFTRDDPEAKAKQGEYRFMPAVAFLELHDRRFWQSIELAAQVGFTVGGVAGVVGAASWVARVVAVVETAINAAGLVVNEYRARLSQTPEGERFLKRWDLVQQLMMVYGLARIVASMPKVLRGLTAAVRRGRSVMTIEDANRFDGRLQEINKALNQAEREQSAARAAAKGGGADGATPAEPEGPAPSPAPEPAAAGGEEAPPASTAAEADPRVAEAQQRLGTALEDAHAAEQRAVDGRSRLAGLREQTATAREELRAAEAAATQADEASRAATTAYERALGTNGAPRAGPRAAHFEARDAAAVASKRLEKARKAVAQTDAEVAAAAKRQEVSERVSKEAAEKVGRAQENLTRAEAAAAGGDVPRLGADEAFDPTRRRPRFTATTPSLKTARGAPGTLPDDAAVRITRVPLKSPAQQQRLTEILSGAETSPQAAGNDFGKLIGEEQGWEQVGERFRARQGQIGRRWDYGNTKEITIEGRVDVAGEQRALGEHKLDQLWFDLNQSGSVDLTVPTLSTAAERQLARLAGEWQRRTGKLPLILVREVAP